MESRAHCARSSVTEIGNRKERLRVREAGASAAGRGQRPYASFPDRQPKRSPTLRSLLYRSPIEPSRASTDRQGSLRSLTPFSSSLRDRGSDGEFHPPNPQPGDPSPDPFFASRLWLVSLRISIKIPLPRHPKGIRRRQGVFFMSHLTNHPAKKWNPPAQTGAPREGNTIASATECTGLTPTEPEDLEQAYALGELSAIHTLRPQKKAGVRSATSRKPPRD